MIFKDADDYLSKYFEKLTAITNLEVSDSSSGYKFCYHLFVTDLILVKTIKELRKTKNYNLICLLFGFMVPNRVSCPQSHC